MQQIEIYENKYIQLIHKKLSYLPIKLIKYNNLNLKTAALKFPYLNSNIATVLTGVTSKEQVLENLKSYSTNITSDLWVELDQKNLINKRSINKL